VGPLGENRMMQRPGVVHSWDGLRKEARHLENEMEASLNSFTKLGTKPMEGRGNGSGAVEHVAVEVEGLLAKLTEVVEAMEAYLASNSTASGNPTMVHTLERHTEILNDYKKEYRKRKGSLTLAREQHELLSGARAKEKGGATTAQQSLYAERAAVTGASGAADAALSQGNSLREQLEHQRAMFASMMQRMETVSGSMPGLTKLIAQIKHKRRRDVMVLALTFSLLLFGTIIWKFF